jgi:RimJ/RimL family protein N-acetyltransferase
MMHPLGFTVTRCTDAPTIEQLLASDYYDFPVSHFSPSVIHAAAKWLAHSQATCFVIAHEGEQYAGFAFASTLGNQLWRQFARQHPWLAPQLLWILVQRRFRMRRRHSPPHVLHALPQADYNKIATLDIPNSNAPFEWSRPDTSIGYVELLYVPGSFRGRDVAPRLLLSLLEHLKEQGVRRVEAHIDAGNYASVRAFVKAQWTVVKSSGGDFMAFADLGKTTTLAPSV